MVFVKTNVQAGSRGISAFIVDAPHSGLQDDEYLQVMSPHPLATLRFKNCRLGEEALLGDLNGGFKIAMRTLDIFRASVASAALGMGRRALKDALAHVKSRQMFGQHLVT